LDWAGFLAYRAPIKSIRPKGMKDPKTNSKMYKIQWSHHTEEEATWKMEEYFNTKYPEFLQSRNREFPLPIFFS
jgi:hypothetical protein